MKGDPVIAAKAITDFIREHETITYKGGIMEGKVLDPDQFKAISRLPGVDVLRGQLTGLVAAPITGVVRGLNGLIQGLATQLGQIAEQGLVTGEAPSAEPAAEEPAAEEAPAEEASEDAPAEEASADGDDEPEAPAADEPAGDDEAAADAEPVTEADADEPETSEQSEETEQGEEAGDADDADAADTSEADEKQEG